MGKKIMLIDGHSMLNRAFYALPDLTNQAGEHTGAVYGFLNILFKSIEEESPTHLTVAFDEHAPTFRHKMYEAYKGTRKAMPEELKQQVPLTREILTAMGVEIVSMEGYEADDVLGTLAKHYEAEGFSVVILTGDRDLLQLVSQGIHLRMPKTVKGQTTIEIYDEAAVLEKYQVSPAQIIELKGLMGDTSDNIPGLPGVGEKTATKMLLSFGTIENAYQHVQEVTPNKARLALTEHIDLARLSKDLATIRTNAPLEFHEEKARMGNLYTPEALGVAKRLELKTIVARFGQQVAESAPVSESIEALTVFSIQSGEGLSSLIEKARSAKYLGVGLLTEGEEVFGLGLSFSKEENYYLPLGPLSREEMKGTLLSLAGAAQLCTMDLKALLGFAELPQKGEVFDAGVGAYLLNPVKGEYPYLQVQRAHVPSLVLKPEEELRKNKKLSQEEEGVREQLAACLSLVPLLAREPILESLKEQGMLSIYTDIELPLIYTLHSMEKWGIACKAQELSLFGEKLSGRIQELMSSIYEKAGESFNVNSPKQLGTILFEKLQIPGGKKTKTGYSTSADILEKLSPEYPIIGEILEYRQLSKLKSTYADALVKEIREDGRVHSTFNQTVTATGRISSQNPNLQNIPIRTELGRELRKAFVPEEGYVFLDADYSQIELRVLAHMSGDEQLIAAYQQAEDIHALTASQVFHVPLEEVTPLQRRNAKAVNFGIVYGISSFGLSQDLSISRKEASEYIEKYFQTYPGIKTFLDSLVEKGKKEGYVTTLYGRRRPVPELSSKNFQQRSFGERIAMNSPIQGTAADIIKIAMNRVRERLEKEKLSSRLLVQVHDELLIETKKEELEIVSAILRDEMQGAAKLSVRLEVDMHEGNSWYEAK